MKLIYSKLFEITDNRLPQIIDLVKDYLAMAERDEAAKALLRTSTEIQRMKLELNYNDWNMLASNLLRYVRDIANQGIIPKAWFNKTAKNIGGGGKYSTTALFNINEMYGIVLRIDKEECDEFRCYVRDDLSSLFSIRVSILGQYTQGE